jgi:glycine betaine/choline ABC-type transport system substrate-binding protein
MNRFVVAVGTIAAVAALACAQLIPVQASGSVAVGARSFTEEQIAGWLYSEMLSAHGIKTSTNVGFTQESEMLTALETGTVSVVPDYLGNGLVDLNQVYKPGTSPKKVLAQVNKAFKKKWKIELLTPAYRFNDQNVFVTTKAISKKYGLKTMSDLARLAPKLSFEVLHECTLRTDCLVGFNKVYRPKKFKNLVDGGTGTSPNNPPFYDDLTSRKYDVVQGYGDTDPQIVRDHLVRLTDNKHLFPPDQMTPFVTQAIVKAHPSIVKLLDRLSATLTNHDFANMDALGYGGEQPQTVAHNYLKRRHLI